MRGSELAVQSLLGRLCLPLSLFLSHLCSLSLSKIKQINLRKKERASGGMTQLLHLGTPVPAVTTAFPDGPLPFQWSMNATFPETPMDTRDRLDGLPSGGPYIQTQELIPIINNGLETQWGHCQAMGTLGETMANIIPTCHVLPVTLLWV